MKLFYFILLSILVYLMQFLVLPLVFSFHLNVFIPFALMYFIFTGGITRILIAAVIFDVFSGLPFPLMSLSLVFTIAIILLAYTLISSDVALSKILIILPLALMVYWFLLYLTGMILGFFWVRFNFPFSVIFNSNFIWHLAYSIGIGALFFLVFRSLVPQHD